MQESHERKCWECGNVATHKSSIVPGVRCKLCGSQDTRKVKQPAKSRHAQFYEKLAALLEEFDVDITTTSSDAPGSGPWVNVQFNRDGFRSDELETLCGDVSREMAGVCQYEDSSS